LRRIGVPCHMRPAVSKPPESSPASSSVTLPGEPPVTVALRRSARARRVSLRVSGTDGRATLTLPRRGSLPEALAFLREREGWLRGHLSRVPPARPAGLGTPVPVEGEERLLLPSPDRRVRLAPGELHVPDRPGAAERALRALARERLVAACARHAGRLGRAHGRITLRDPRSRWGSCSSRGDLMFSWRLVMAPPGVLDYVAAHEVAHLERMDHSPAFWAVVARLRPDFAEARDWLREHGAALHRIHLT
jgi:predicted metal-dependent hydrolase